LRSYSPPCLQKSESENKGKVKIGIGFVLFEIVFKQRGGKMDELYETCPVVKTFMALIDGMLQYCNVLREVKPKQELIANVEKELVEVNSKLKIK